jgi:adenylate cyclase
MLNSKQLIEITGISRATLNNYVAQGILPNPVVKTPIGDGNRATRLGYFDEDAVERIKQVKSLKKQGLSMAEIARQLSTPANATRSPAKLAVVPADGSARSVEGTPTPPSRTSSPQMGFDIAIDELPGPAYMVNNNFELIWWNEAAREQLFGAHTPLAGDLGSRNLLKVLFAAKTDPLGLADLLRPHLAAGKRRLAQPALLKLYSTLEAQQLSLLQEVLASVEKLESVGKGPLVHFPILLRDVPGTSEPTPFDLYACFYREGILFTYSPIELKNDYLLEFLRHRNYVINELLKKRKPCLTDVTVMVADLQNSVKICAELPAEEYFELINAIWQQSEPIFRKYYGTHGKHAGDGMVYYFFPQPDCDHRLNAIQCALELKQLMVSLTRIWQARKGWFSELCLNIGLNSGQEWFGSYHAGGHVEFTVLGETINFASRISDFARQGAIWATKSMLSQIDAATRSTINFGIARRTQGNESVFVRETYASINSLLDDEGLRNAKFRDIERVPLTEIRAIDLVSPPAPRD